MGKKSLDVVVLGNFVLDVVFKPVNVEDMPERGHLKLVKSEVHLGGAGCITSIALAKLGVKVGVIGKMGDDDFGYLIEKNLQRYGIDTTGLLKSSATSTSDTGVLVDEKGERTFLHDPAGNADLVYDDITDLLDYIRSARHFHAGHFGLLPGLEPDLARLFKEVKTKGEESISLDVAGHPDVLEQTAKQSGPSISLDTGGMHTEASREKIRPCLQYVDIFLPSLDEAKLITGGGDIPQIAETFLSGSGIEVFGIKLGEHGCYLRRGKEKWFVPAFDIEVVDTLGCGDSFYAGFIKAHLEGWDLPECGKFANAVGACCAAGAGGTSGIKSFRRTLRFMGRTPRKGEKAQ